MKFNYLISLNYHVKLRLEFSREAQVTNSPPFLAIDEISIYEIPTTITSTTNETRATSIFTFSTTNTATQQPGTIATFSTTTTTTFETQSFGNTINSCFYAKYYGIRGGVLIASIEISGSIELIFSQCCEKCM